MATVATVFLLSLAVLQGATAQSQQSFSTADDCSRSCKHGSCLQYAPTAWVCECQPGFSGAICDHLLVAGNTQQAPAPAPDGFAPVVAPSQAPTSLLDCGLGAHAKFDNGTVYCNCAGTNMTGQNCDQPLAPAPSAAVPSPAVSSPSAGPAAQPASAPAPSMTTKPAVSPSSALQQGTCPQGSMICTPCPTGSYCLNGGTCPSGLSGTNCECPTFGAQQYGGAHCETVMGSVNSNSTANSNFSAPSALPPSSGSHISGVAIAVIVIFVFIVVAALIGAFAFWKARGRRSKFDRFAEQPEIFRGATSNL